MPYFTNSKESRVKKFMEADTRVKTANGTSRTQYGLVGPKRES